MVLLVLEAHGALHFRRSVNELAQRIERQHMIVAAGIDELKLARLVEAPLRIAAREQEALNLVGRIQRVAALLVELVRIALQHAADVAGVERSVLVDDRAEYQHLAIAE